MAILNKDSDLNKGVYNMFTVEGAQCAGGNQP